MLIVTAVTQLALCGAIYALIVTGRRERHELYTRIQHPHLAPTLEHQDHGPAYVPFDDDDAFHDAEREALNGN